ncbi:hypothetical protein [Chloracidobacterium aggregatum]|uniref:hypothetical protein n=1 Tax=Chloracidobacterium aggregatum TaxID=2851959 RepID=UPI001B8D2F75|nr:hypothetical protein [Chloracidobacterium aggregatum]QUV88425.1 hypothetical protein J8C07_03615 [Chloracidobacterium sp. S]QUV91342.1 hypothetical protein J8C04_02745 [Chloracidobacterium sp. A]
MVLDFNGDAIATANGKAFRTPAAKGEASPKRRPGRVEQGQAEQGHIERAPDPQERRMAPPQ